MGGATPSARLRRLVSDGPLPPGALIVGLALGVNGVAAYAFLGVASRSLGPTAYAPLSVLWALTFVAAPGLLLPLEQETGRAVAARRVRGVGSRPLIIRAAAVGGGLVGLVVVASLAVAGPVTDRFFDGQALLLVGFALAVACYSVYFLARGVVAGNGRFGAYASILIVESLLRIAGVAALAAGGVHSAGIYSLAIGIPCLVSVVLVLPRQHRIAEPGPPASWGEISSALALLLVGSLLAQVLLNIPPLAVKIVGTADSGDAGRVLNGLIVSRVPLFFFQAVQASLLPRLSHLAAAGRTDEFTALLRRLLALLAGLVVVSVLGMLALGPIVVRVVFGAGYEVGRGDLALLALGSETMMIALALSQALVALSGYGRSALGWLAGTLAVAAVMAATPTLGALSRSEAAFVSGVAVACVVLSLGLAGSLAERRRAVPESEEVSPQPSR